MRIISLFYIAIFAFSSSFAQQQFIIPLPADIHFVQKGTFTLNSNTPVIYHARAEKSAAYLTGYCQEVYRLKLLTRPTSGANQGTGQIRLEYDENMAPGQYNLGVSSNGIKIRGSEDGILYGIMSLIQLMPVAGDDLHQSIAIPFIEIRDQPRFSYRGMLLDAGRYFFPVDFLKKCIDNAARYKLNYFQLHLTDDQGWRIEIKKYPELNNTGSWRNGTMKGLWPGTGNDSIRHGGYYTQQQLKDLVKYAEERYVTLIPEIEMPGHALAALASYSYLGCTGGPYKVKETWGAGEDVFCAGKESTFEFLQDVLDEVLEIFPSAYIHVGGDECPKTRWEQCTACQLRIKTEGLKDESELQNYFITRIAKFLNAKGRTIIGWDEILEGGTPPGAVIMSWRGAGEKGCIDAVRAGHPVILSPGYGFYLDYPQTSHEDSLAADWGGVTPLRKTYMYEPVNDSIKQEQTHFILGGQANIWTEYINNASKFEYMAFPRLSAASEVLWSPREKRNWDNFKARIKKHYDRYNMWGIKFNPADPDEE